jgi:hypothetical protein
MTTKYLTIEGRKLLEKQIEKQNYILDTIAKTVEPGSGALRLKKQYIHGLEFLIDMEENAKTKNEVG